MDRLILTEKHITILNKNLGFLNYLSTNVDDERMRNLSNRLIKDFNNYKEVGYIRASDLAMHRNMIKKLMLSGAKDYLIPYKIWRRNRIINDNV